MKENNGISDCIFIVDFNENYLCKFGSETQTVHFGASRQQVTLHTAVMYYETNDADAEQLQCVSFCTISSSLRHELAAIWMHLLPIFRFIAKTLLLVDSISIWSDGPTTQYHKKNFGLFTRLANFVNYKNASWYFSESSHGKGSPHGIGGSSKRQADNLVAHGCDFAKVEDFCCSRRQHLQMCTSSLSSTYQALTQHYVKPVEGQCCYIS